MFERKRKTTQVKRYVKYLKGLQLNEEFRQVINEEREKEKKKQGEESETFEKNNHRIKEKEQTTIIEQCGYKLILRQKERKNKTRTTWRRTTQSRNEWSELIASCLMIKQTKQE